MTFNKDKILGPWEKCIVFKNKKRSLIGKLFYKENINYVFGRINIDGTCSKEVFHSKMDDEWFNNFDNRFIKTNKTANDAMKHADEMLLLEGYYLIDDQDKFEKLKVLI